MLIMSLFNSTELSPLGETPAADVAVIFFISNGLTPNARVYKLYALFKKLGEFAFKETNGELPDSVSLACSDVLF